MPNKIYTIPHTDVVAAINNALSILELTSNTDLRQFMIEIAIMESGGSPRGLEQISHHTKNPFQLTSIAIQDTKRNADGGVHYTMKPLHALIKTNSNLNNPWHSQTNNEIKNNVKLNALAALLLIMRKRIIPASTINTRATQWKANYNTIVDTHGTAEKYIKRNNLPIIPEGIEIMFPKQKLFEAKQLDDVLYQPLHQAIIDSQFWNENNDYEDSDYSKILQTNVDQTEAAETLTADLNFFFVQNKIPVTAAVHSPDPFDNTKTIINPGHPNYPNKLVIGGNQGIAGKDNKKHSSKFLMNLFLGTFGDNFSISDIDPKILAQNIGKLIRHEIIHLYQIEARRKRQRISRISTLEKYRDEKEIPAEDDPRDVYLSSKMEIDAYAHEFAEELLQDHGKEKALAIIRGDIKLNDLNQSEQFHEFMSNQRPGQMLRRLKRKIYSHIMSLADREIYK
jgi:hypothetical protein